MSMRPPGTASRLTTGMNRPMTRGANIPNQNVMLNLARAEDRPMTRGGLGGFQPTSSGFNRQVQDKTYFLGLLRSKIAEMNNETIRMDKEINLINSDNSIYLSYGKKHEELLQHIEESKGELADYNMVLDRLNTSSSVSDLKTDYANLKIHNDQETKALDLIFIEKGKKEDVIKRHEKEIGDEKREGKKCYRRWLSGSIRAKYEKIKMESERLQESLNNYQAEIDNYKSKMESMKQQIGLSGAKQEALNLLEQLHIAELMNNELTEETKNDLSPAEQIEKLLLQIRDSNKEKTSIEKQINEFKETNSSLKSELEEEIVERKDQEDDDPENQKEMAQKYKELKKREMQMDEFLSNFEETRRNETEQLYNTRKSIVNYLELISKAVEKINKERGLINNKGKDSECTVAELRRVDDLEKKVTTEYEKLKEKKEMDENMKKFLDIEGLKRRSEARRQQLLTEKQNLTRYNANSKSELELQKTQFKAIQVQLYDNETHNQLNNQEKKLQALEQTNFSLKEKISSALAESDYEAIKSKVLTLVSEHNKWLQKQMLNPGYNY